LALGAALWLACGGNGKEGELRQNVLSDSLAAFSQLQSYEVKASGQLRQGGQSADIELSYEFVGPDRLRYLSGSTSEGNTDQAGLIIVGQQNWSLGDGTWTEEPGELLDVQTFSAERIWGLVPFSSARLQEGIETINGAEAHHYVFDASAKLSFELLAGALLAGPEPEFTGDLTQFTIDYWIDALGGWPVRMELVAEGGGERKAELTVELARLNDASIQIEPP